MAQTPDEEELNLSLSQPYMAELKYWSGNNEQFFLSPKSSGSTVQVQIDDQPLFQNSGYSTSNSNINVNSSFLAPTQLSPGLVVPHPLQDIPTDGFLSPHFNGFGGYSALDSARSDTGSTHSLYSNAALAPRSPFQELPGLASAAGSMVGAPNARDTIEDQSEHQLSSNFDREISLGQSVSNVNLVHFNSDSMQPAPFDSSELNRKLYLQPQNELQSPQLTENNLFNYKVGYSESYSDPNADYFSQDLANTAQNLPGGVFASTPHSAPYIHVAHEMGSLHLYNGAKAQSQVLIATDQPPEAVAGRTPSLFSTPSHNSPLKDSSALRVQYQSSYYGSAPSRHTEPLLEPENADSRLHLNPGDLLGRRSGSNPGSDVGLKPSSRSGSHSSSRAERRSVSPFLDVGADEVSDDDLCNPAEVSRQRILDLAAASASKSKQIHPSSFACHMCDKRFTRTYNLKSHLRTHAQERPFMCKVCGKSFARQHDRKRHDDLHLGERKYVCKGILRNGTEFGCGKKFARADALRRHFQTELGKKCIRLLVEEDEREQDGELVSDTQPPSGKVMNPLQADVLVSSRPLLLASQSPLHVPTVSVVPPE